MDLVTLRIYLHRYSLSEWKFYAFFEAVCALVVIFAPSYRTIGKTIHVRGFLRVAVADRGMYFAGWRIRASEKYNLLGDEVEF